MTFIISLVLAINIFALNAADAPSSAKQSGIMTIFYPGMSSDNKQGAKYAFPTGNSLVTGELAWSSRAIKGFIPGSFFPYHELDEVIYYPLKNSTARNPTTFFTKPLWSAKSSVINWWFGVSIVPDKEPFDPKYSGLTATNHAIDLTRVNIGQTRDLNNHKEKVSLCAKMYPDTPQVHFGVSRGALTTFRAEAEYAKEEAYKNATCVILEGCPDTAHHTMQERWSTWGGNYVNNKLGNFCEYNPEEDRPVKEFADKYPKTLHTLLITSSKDTVVTAACSSNVANGLKEAGHQQLYYLILKNSSHSGYPTENEEDRRTYEAAIHAFYQRAGLPEENLGKKTMGYDPALANKGQKYLDAAKIS